MRGLSLFAYFAAEKARVCNERLTANGDYGHRIRSCFLLTKCDRYVARDLLAHLMMLRGSLFGTVRVDDDRQVSSALDAP